MNGLLLGSPGVSSEYGAEMEMVTDIARAVGPVLRAKFSRVHIALREPPQVAATAMVVQLGDELHDLTVEQQAEMVKVMDVIRDSSKRLFPTVPLKLEILRPPVSPRWGFVAHVEPSERRIYPRIVKARAVTRPSNRGRAVAALGAT